jgi:hypothetical protein
LVETAIFYTRFRDWQVLSHGKTIPAGIPQKRRPSGLLFLVNLKVELLHNELNGFGEAVGFDVAEVDAALEVDADGVFTQLQALAELLHSLANEVEDSDVGVNIHG